MELVWPAKPYLPGYIHALQQGWSPDNLRPEAALDHLAHIAADAGVFVPGQVDREAKGAPITLPDGSTVKRLPGFSLWMWDGEFCGSVGFRWQPGTTELPAYCLGHVGYSVVPWEAGARLRDACAAVDAPGYARAEGLSFVELTTDADNVASRRVIEANGGTLVERFKKLQRMAARTAFVSAFRWNSDLARICGDGHGVGVMERLLGFSRRDALRGSPRSPPPRRCLARHGRSPIAIRWTARSRTTRLVFAAADGAPPRSPRARSSAAAPTA